MIDLDPQASLTTIYRAKFDDSGTMAEVLIAEPQQRANPHPHRRRGAQLVAGPSDITGDKLVRMYPNDEYPKQIFIHPITALRLSDILSQYARETEQWDEASFCYTWSQIFELHVERSAQHLRNAKH